MPISKLDFKPGVNREATTYANEGGYYAGDKIRFRSGRPEKLGGWINQASAYTYDGVARTLWNWVPTTGENLLGVGTNQKYYIENGGQYNDITPIRYTSDPVGTDPFSVTNGSKVVNVADAGHGAAAGDYVIFSDAVAVGGLTLNGEFEIVEVVDSNEYIILSPTAATSTAVGGGSVVVAEYLLTSGSATYTVGTGWGAGAWGIGGWGEAATGGGGIGIDLRLWSQDNFENDLIINPRDGAIYYWETDTSTYGRAVTLESMSNSLDKVSTAATFTSGVSTITVDDATGITSGCVVSGTGIATGTFVAESYNGGLSIPLSANTTGASSGIYAFSYAGRHVPNKTLYIIASDTSHFTIALGSNPYNPTDFSTDFDPLLVRWSDQDNPFEWVPAITNQAGEQHISNGSYLVTAVDNRQEILVWSDSALFSMQYIGPPYVWSFNLINSNLSIASPNAAITINGVTYWMGIDKFYLYNGRVDTMPCTLRQYIFTNINRDQLYQITCGSNEGYSEVWWFYPSANSLVNDSYVIYNYLDNVWYYGTLSRTAWLDSPLRAYPMGAFSVQLSYLDGALSSTATSVTLLNGASYPASGTITIDSEQITYTGITGNTLTGCVRGANNTTAASHDAYAKVTYNVPNQIMFHEYGNDDQSTTVAQPIEAYVESSDFDIGDGHNFGFVWRILPDITFAGSTVSEPRVFMTVKARQNSGTNYAAADQPTVTRTNTVPVEQYTGQVYTRVRGRQMTFRIDSTELGVAWQLGTPRIDIRPDGRR